MVEQLKAGKRSMDSMEDCLLCKNTNKNNNNEFIFSAIITAVLPSKLNGYKKFILRLIYKYQDNTEEELVETICTDKTFKTVTKNMFNQKNPEVKEILLW